MVDLESAEIHCWIETHTIRKHKVTTGLPFCQFWWVSRSQFPPLCYFIFKALFPSCLTILWYPPGSGFYTSPSPWSPDFISTIRDRVDNNLTLQRKGIVQKGIRPCPRSHDYPRADLEWESKKSLRNVRAAMALIGPNDWTTPWLWASAYWVDSGLSSWMVTPAGESSWGAESQELMTPHLAISRQSLASLETHSFVHLRTCTCIYTYELPWWLC